MIKKDKKVGSMHAVVQRFVMLIKFYIDRYGAVWCGVMRCVATASRINSAPWRTFCMIRTISFRLRFCFFFVLCIYTAFDRSEFIQYIMPFTGAAVVVVVAAQQVYLHSFHFIAVHTIQWCIALFLFYLHRTRNTVGFSLNSMFFLFLYANKRINVHFMFDFNVLILYDMTSLFHSIYICTSFIHSPLPKMSFINFFILWWFLLVGLSISLILSLYSVVLTPFAFAITLICIQSLCLCLSLTTNSLVA